MKGKNKEFIEEVDKKLICLDENNKITLYKYKIPKDIIFSPLKSDLDHFTFTLFGKLFNDQEILEIGFSDIRDRKLKEKLLKRAEEVINEVANLIKTNGYILPSLLIAKEIIPSQELEDFVLFDPILLISKNRRRKKRKLKRFLKKMRTLGWIPWNNSLLYLLDQIDCFYIYLRLKNYKSEFSDFKDILKPEAEKFVKKKTEDVKQLKLTAFIQK